MQIVQEENALYHKLPMSSERIPPNAMRSRNVSSHTTSLKAAPLPLSSRHPKHFPPCTLCFLFYPILHGPFSPPTPLLTCQNTVMLSMAL